MSGIKGVIKYISQLLILSSFSIIFLPIICLKCYEEKSEISIFKFMQWSIGKSTKSFLDADMEFVIGRQMKIYIVCALIWVMVTVIFTIIILLVQSQLSYYIAIVATVYKGNIIKNLIMDCQSYTKYRPNETTGGIFVSWRRKEELPTGA